MLSHVEVEAVPSNLPDELTVNGEKLVELGDKLTVADIIAPEGVIIMTEPEHTVAIVEETKAQLSEESEETTEETTEGATEAEATDKEPVKEKQ
jgi:large subunit ribosomal protein L25